MALDNLQGVIERLEDKIKVHGGYLSGHETRTRQVLIDPLLRELGWDVSDPDAVQLEYKVGKQWADYALMSDGHPVAVIEAKPLGNDLEDDEMMQVLNYANRDGIEYMIVTDGDRWEMYEVFQRGALEERLSMKLALSQQSAHKNTLQALAIWRPNLVSEGGPSEAAEPVFISSDSTPHRPSNKPDESPEQQPPDDPPKGGGRGEKRKNPPTRLVVTMPNGEDIDHPAAIDTFAAAIEELGVDRVRGVFPELNIKAQTNTDAKKRILERVAERLGEPIKVKIVPKTK